MKDMKNLIIKKLLQQKKQMSKDKIIKDFFNLLKKDEGYRIGWQSNIAMAFKDVYDWSDNKQDIHTIANIASTAFLNTLLQKKCDWMDIAEKLY